MDSGLCVGVGSTAVAGTKVALEPCGVSSKTVWIKDYSNAAGIFGSYVPLINGSDTNFSQPFVMTYPANGYPTDMPRVQLYTTNLTGFSQGSWFQPDRCEQQPAVGCGHRRSSVGRTLSLSSE